MGVQPDDLVIWWQQKPITQAVAKKQEKVVAEQLPRPAEFFHPYRNRSHIFQMFFKLQRYITLFLMATPLIAKWVYAAIVHPGDPDWEDWLADNLLVFMQRGGCSFQKFGQWMSMRPDMFSQLLVNKMALLRQDSPAHSARLTRKIFKEQFGCDVDDVFDEWSDKPIASGSIAQIHRGRLKAEYAMPDGSLDVAVKVRHPSVLDESYCDLLFIADLLPVANAIQSHPVVWPFAMESVQATIAKQMDLRWEAYSLQRFKRNFAHEDEILSSSLSFPDLHGRFVGEAVLVESWAPGTTVAEMFPLLADRSWDRVDLSAAEPLVEDGRNNPSPRLVKRRLARQVMDLAMKMFLRDNYIHGDMHAGNLLYSPEHNLLSILDTGLTAEVPQESTEAFGEFLRGICFNDSDLVAERLVEFHDPGAKGKTPDLEMLREILQVSFDELFQADLVDIGTVVGTTLKALPECDIVLQSDIAYCISTMSILEALIRSLDPDFDVVKASFPYFVRFKGWDTVKQVQDYGTDARDRAAARHGSKV